MLRERIGGGLSSDVFLLGDDRVLKVFRPYFFRNAEKEYRKTRIAGGLGIPVPELYALTRTEDGRAAIEMERIPGTNMAEYMRVHPAEWPSLVHKMVRLSARIHQVSCVYSGEDADFAAARLDLKRGMLSVFSDISRLQCVSPEETRRMLRFYESLPESRGFVHGDFDPSNIIVSGRERTLRLIDYSESGFGSRLFDLQRMYDLHYEPRTLSCSRLRLVMKRLFFRYYLRVFLKNEWRDGSPGTGVVMHTLGAMLNIARLAACATSCPWTVNDDVRHFADRALCCIDALPDGIFPPG